MSRIDNISMKKKVLLVPAWYPSLEDPLLGSFFQEQMRLVQSEFDFKILIGKRTEIGKKKAIKQYLKSGSFNKIVRNDYQYEQKEQTFAIDYQYIKLLPPRFELNQYIYICKYFDSLFNELIQSNWKPDLIHIQSLSDTAVFACFIAQKYNTPIILTEHNVYPFDSNDFWGNKRKKVYNQVNKVLCTSHYVLRHLLVHNCEITKSSIIGNYVNDIVFTDHNWPDNKVTQILFVASHPYCKDFDTLISSVKELVLINLDFIVNVVGFDQATNTGVEFIRNVQEQRLEKYFVLKGRKSRVEMVQEYAQNTLLVSTSYSETFGLAIAEAILNSLPVVCTDSGGIREFVNEASGIIVPIKEPKEVAKAITSVLKNIDKYNTIQMHNSIRDNYGKEAFSKRLTIEYLQQIHG
jgi:glycosyltransferase involved in cell wall biosynthesis